jgi:hypothetical protein
LRAGEAVRSTGRVGLLDQLRSAGRQHAAFESKSGASARPAVTMKRVA